MRTRTEITTSVASRDGTEIAYWTSGSGPPIVLVHGSPADHTRWRPLIPCLEHRVSPFLAGARRRRAYSDARTQS
jgi:pimeloyl-ACP methyl ester carboxylesterase